MSKRRKMNPGAKARRAARKMPRRLSLACIHVMQMRGIRMRASGLARKSAAQGIDAAVKYCAPWRKALRWLASKLPIEILHGDDGTLYVGVGWRPRARWFVSKPRA